jgi:hypothetical protein
VFTPGGERRDEHSPYGTNFTPGAKFTPRGEVNKAYEKRFCLYFRPYKKWYTNDHFPSDTKPPNLNANTRITLEDLIVSDDPRTEETLNLVEK